METYSPLPPDMALGILDYSLSQHLSCGCDRHLYDPHPRASSHYVKLIHNILRQ